MRTKPVTRDEVRMDYRGRWGFNFRTVPANAFKKAGEYYAEPIASLWKPLLRQLYREQLRLEEEYREQHARWAEVGLASADDPPKPLPAPSLDNMHARTYRRVSCSKCRRAFYRCGSRDPGSSKYCSDGCAKKAAEPQRKRTIARQVARRAETRAKARANRKCQSCGEPMEAARATKLFCSTRCRVAGHRGRAGRPGQLRR